MKWRTVASGALAVTLLVLCAGGDARTEEKSKIVLIGHDRDHPFGTHEYMADCRLLAKCLEQTPGVEAVVSNGWPWRAGSAPIAIRSNASGLPCELFWGCAGRGLDCL